MSYSRQRRFIPLLDFIIFGGLAVLSTVVMIIIFCTAQNLETSGYVVLIVTIVGFWTNALLVILGKWFDRPDYYAECGAAVWTCKNSDLPMRDMVDQAFRNIADRLPQIVGVYPLINHRTLTDLFSHVSVEWVANPITLYSHCGWVMKDKAGLQKGTRIMVQLPGLFIKKSAFFHEMGHMIRQRLLGKPGDTHHGDREWWSAIEKLTDEYIG